MKFSSGNIARQASRSFLYGDIRLAIHIKPASAKSFATSPRIQIVINLEMDDIMRLIHFPSSSEFKLFKFLSSKFINCEGRNKQSNPN